MKGEIVWTTTSDKTRLHGFFVESSRSPEVAADAAILLHGLAGNFYSSGLLNHLARQLVDLGVNVLLGNTRGHDFLNLTTQMGRSITQGAAMEDVADAQFDVAGWVQFLVAAGHRRIVLLGHSLGAIKALYSQAVAADLQVAGIAALSATRLNYDCFVASSAREQFLTAFRTAQSLVDAGRGSELFRAEFPFPTWMTADSYLDKYGPQNRFDWTGWIGQVSQPVLLTFGTRELEEHPAFAGLEPVARQLAAAQANLQVECIPQADHFYVACFDPLWTTIETWLKGLDPERNVWHQR